MNDRTADLARAELHHLIDKRAFEAKAEIATLALAAIEELGRFVIFHRRSVGQRRRYSNARRILGNQS